MNSTLFGNLPLLQTAAAGQAGAGGQLVTMVVTFGLIIVVFYFLVLRPQNKKQKETQKMLAAVKKGDRVVTIGGLRGVVASVREDAVVLKVDDDTKIEFSKSAISQVLEQHKEEKEEETGKEQSVQKKD
jgi:preprotein translocase subunit YajC